MSDTKLTPEERSAIASRAGKLAHAKGTAHEFTSETAREAGKAGGKKRAATTDMRELGRQGGLKRAARMRERAGESAASAPEAEAD